MQTIFEHLGYHIDFYNDENKFIGSIKVEEKDRDVIGYQGRQKTVLQEDIVLKKKTYKKGTVVTTELIPLCGKVIN